MNSDTLPPKSADLLTFNDLLYPSEYNKNKYYGKYRDAVIWLIILAIIIVILIIVIIIAYHHKKK